MPKKPPFPSSQNRKTTKRQDDALKLHRNWLAQAEAVATQPINKGGSPHPTVKVGAILVNRKGRLITASSNRFANGVDRRRAERYREGQKSLWMNCAEQLAIASALKARADTKGATLYVTLEPCAICAGMIAELHIKQVFVPVGAMRRYARLKAKWKNSIEIGLVKLAEAGVRLTAIDTQKSK